MRISRGYEPHCNNDHYRVPVAQDSYCYYYFLQQYLIIIIYISFLYSLFFPLLFIYHIIISQKTALFIIKQLLILFFILRYVWGCQMSQPGLLSSQGLCPWGCLVCQLGLLTSQRPQIKRGFFVPQRMTYNRFLGGIGKRVSVLIHDPFSAALSRDIIRWYCDADLC